MGITLMASDYDVQYTTGQDIGHADAISRLRFKDDETTQLRKEMQSNEFTKRMMNRIRTGNWKNRPKMEKTFMNVSNALTVQNDLIYNGSRVFTPITCRKQVIEKFHEVHQGINALKNLVKYCVVVVYGQRYRTLCQKLPRMQQKPTETD